MNGLANADAAHTAQVDQTGAPYSCLLQLDVNLTVPPLTKVCDGTTPRGVAFNSHFRANTWFTIDNFIGPDATTCPKPKDSFAFPNGILNGSGVGIAGGCTRDLVHKFYQEQYQLNGGAQNRYATGSDSAGTVMGVYDTRSLPIYRYLHGNAHPHYAIADNFFQAALRWFVPQSPVADRRARRRPIRTHRPLSTRWSTRRASRGTTIRCTTRIRASRTETATSRCRVRRRRPVSPAVTGP